MDKKIETLLKSTNRDDYILGMEYYCREKGLEYFKKLLCSNSKDFIVPCTIIKFTDFSVNIRNVTIKLPAGIAIVSFGDGDYEIGTWSDYYQMTPGKYASFWVHEILDI